MLPYILNSEGYVEAPLDFIDSRDKETAFEAHPYSQLERRLEAGDRIVAVDGIAVNKGYQILDLLQQHKIQIIVERKQPANQTASWTQEDQIFEEHLNERLIANLSLSIGSSQASPTSNHYTLLKPVEPKPVDRFVLSPEAQAQIREAYQKKKETIERMRDPSKRMTGIAL